MTNDFNLACIMVMPPYQRRGFGKFLIALSYALSKNSGRICTPERPLSDMGKVGYKSYWTDVLLEAVLDMKKKSIDSLTVSELCQQTGIQTEDIITTLQQLNLLKYWRGQQLVNASGVSAKQI